MAPSRQASMKGAPTTEFAISGGLINIVPGTPVVNVVTVAATITAGPSAKLYVRVIAVETL